MDTEIIFCQSYLARCSRSASDAQVRRGVGAQHFRLARRRLDIEPTDGDVTRPIRTAVDVGHNRVILVTGCAAEARDDNIGQLGVARVLLAVVIVLAIATLDLEGIIGVVYGEIGERHITDRGSAVVASTRISLDSGGFGGVDHGCARDIDILDRVVAGLAQRPHGNAMGAGAADGVDGHVVGAGLEGHTVIIVDDGDLSDGYISTLADVEAISVLGRVV